MQGRHRLRTLGGVAQPERHVEPAYCDCASGARKGITRPGTLAAQVSARSMSCSPPSPHWSSVAMCFFVSKALADAKREHRRVETVLVPNVRTWPVPCKRSCTTMQVLGLTASLRLRWPLHLQHFFNTFSFIANPVGFVFDPACFWGDDVEAIDNAHSASLHMVQASLLLLLPLVLCVVAAVFWFGMIVARAETQRLPARTAAKGGDGLGEVDGAKSRFRDRDRIKTLYDKDMTRNGSKKQGGLTWKSFRRLIVHHVAAWGYPWSPPRSSRPGSTTPPTWGGPRNCASSRPPGRPCPPTKRDPVVETDHGDARPHPARGREGPARQLRKLPRRVVEHNHQIRLAAAVHMRQEGKVALDDKSAQRANSRDG